MWRLTHYGTHRLVWTSVNEDKVNDFIQITGVDRLKVNIINGGFIQVMFV